MAFPQAAQGGTRKILNYSAIKLLNLPTVNAFAARYTTDYCYVAPTPPAIEYPTHALFPMFAKRWQTRQEPFWWNVIARKDIENKRTVRSWVARRLRHAFVESLKKKGYKPDGHRIDGNGVPLIGTAQLFPHHSILRKKFVDLVYQTDLTVEAILIRRNTYKPPRTGQEVQRERRPLHWKKKAKKAPANPETPYRHPTSRIIKF